MKAQLIVSERKVDAMGVTMGAQIPSVPLMGGMSAALGYSTEYVVTAPSISSHIRVVGGDKAKAIEKAKAAIRDFIGTAETVEVDI